MASRAGARGGAGRGPRGAARCHGIAAPGLRHHRVLAQLEGNHVPWRRSPHEHLEGPLCGLELRARVIERLHLLENSALHRPRIEAKRARAETHVLNDRSIAALTKSLEHVTEPILSERLLAAI